MNGVILGVLVGVSRKLALASTPWITKYIYQSLPYPPGEKGLGRGPSLASKKSCCCECALSPFIDCILGKKSSSTFIKGLGIKHVLVVERLAMCPLHSTLNFRGVGGSGPGCDVAMLIC